MTSSAQTPALDPDPELGPERDSAPEKPLWQLAVRWVLGLGVLLIIAFLLGRWLRPELEVMGRGFVERFGLWGMALGTWLADAFHCPIPPQFYMLLAIAGNGPQLPPLLAITAASLAGGATGYTLARTLGGVPRVARFFARSSRAVCKLYDKHGYGVVIGASLTPIAFSMLCYAAGVCRLPKRAFALVALIRIPKLIAYYYLVRLGWAFS
jgi:membrane protein YqaA with SNARE-associated domain